MDQPNKRLKLLHAKVHAIYGILLQNLQESVTSDGPIHKVKKPQTLVGSRLYEMGLEGLEPPTNGL
jgi:hypothetical protein